MLFCYCDVIRIIGQNIQHHPEKLLILQLLGVLSSNLQLFRLNSNLSKFGPIFIVESTTFMILKTAQIYNLQFMTSPSTDMQPKPPVPGRTLEVTKDVTKLFGAELDCQAINKAPINAQGLWTSTPSMSSLGYDRKGVLRTGTRYRI